MRTKEWPKLSPETRKALSCVKIGVVLHLMTILPKEDKIARDTVSGQSFLLKFKGGKSLNWNLLCTNGELQVISGRLHGASLTLRGRREEEIGAMLTDRIGKVFPIPGSFRFLKVAKTFKTLASRIPLWLGGEEGKKNKPFQTELLLEAALMGVVQVANYDPYVQTRTSKMGNGLIEVNILDRPELTRYVDVDRGHFSLGRMEDEKVSARLIFQDAEIAHSLLSGQLRAMSALGDGRIQIRGKLPLIQGLFPMLDRFSYFMSVV